MYPWRKPELFKPLIKSLNRFHIWIYEKYDGRFIGQYNGLPFCLMKVRGRKTGNIITIALLTIPNGDDYILVASQGGAKTNPLWYYNLKENPEIEMQVFSDTFKMRAKELSSDEKNELWPSIIEAYPGYENYQKVTNRNIPVFICKRI